MSSGKWQPFCLGLNVLTIIYTGVEVKPLVNNYTCFIFRYTYWSMHQSQLLSATCGCTLQRYIRKCSVRFVGENVKLCVTSCNFVITSLTLGLPIFLHMSLFYSTHSQHHYSNSTWVLWRLKSPVTWLCAQQIVQANNTGQTKTEHHYLFVRKYTNDQQIPLKKGR